MKRSALIVGGGIAGLSAAIALGRSGWSVELIERAENWNMGGTGIHLPGNAMRALEWLSPEAAKEVREQGFAIDRLVYCDPQGRRQARLELARDFADWPGFVACRRDLVHQALVQAAGDIPISFGCEVTALEEADGMTTARLSDGTERRVDLVVGADGLRSAIRRNVVSPGDEPAYQGFQCWRFMAPRPQGCDVPYYLTGRQRVFMVMPVGADAVYCFAGLLNPDATAPVSDDRKEVAGLFKGFGGVTADILARTDSWTSFLPGRLEQVTPRCWTRGRTVVIGDAAHGTLPTLAQGAGMAMEDALVLAETLADCPTGKVQEALQAFAGRRMPRAQWVQQQSVKRMSLLKAGNPAVVGLRNFIFAKIGPKVLASGWRPLIEEHP